LSYRYLINPNELNNANIDNQEICFKVKSMDAKNENHSRSVKVENGKYICECQTFVNCGNCMSTYILCLAQASIKRSFKNTNSSLMVNSRQNRNFITQTIIQ